jgi:N-methylhydantoinase B/oxoprolinase/acetone carboxylase alpha subunit
MTLSILTERRVHCPPGLEGGDPGACGRNTLKRMGYKTINLGPKAVIGVDSGVINTIFYIIIRNFYNREKFESLNTLEY